MTSALKTLVHPTTGHVFKMGRRTPVPVPARGNVVRFADFMTNDLPLPPKGVDYAAKAMACLDQVMLNDQLSNCTAAAAFHVEGTWLANAGRPTKFSNDQVRAFYSQTTGYDPKNPATDQGGDEITVLNSWKQHGLYKGGHHILGHMVIDGTNQRQMQQALWLFENLYFGVSLPDAWVNPMPEKSGWTWDVAGDPDPNNGHAFMSASYDPRIVGICSWGMYGGMTYDAVAKYTEESGGGELHCVVSVDCLDRASAKAPNGLDIHALTAAFKKLGGRI